MFCHGSSLDLYACPFLHFLAGLTSLESSSIDGVVSLCKTLEFPSDQLLGNMSRVLKPGGAVLFYLASQTAGEQMVICSFVRFLPWWRCM